MTHREWPNRNEWPKSEFVGPAGSTLAIIDEVGFAQSRADAAMSRLKAAVAALKVVADTDGVFCVVAQRALEEIGEVPEWHP